MTYELQVRTPHGQRDAIQLVGTLDFAELPDFARLQKRSGAGFLHRVSNLFEDQVFSPADVGQALGELLPLLLQDLSAGERHLLHKLLAVLAYAERAGCRLFGVAD
jgi:hypothetical protein